MNLARMTDDEACRWLCMTAGTRSDRDSRAIADAVEAMSPGVVETTMAGFQACPLELVA